MKLNLIFFFKFYKIDAGRDVPIIKINSKNYGWWCDGYMRLLKTNKKIFLKKIFKKKFFIKFLKKNKQSFFFYQ